MLRKMFVMSFTLACAFSIAEAADTPSARTNLSAADIVSKNVQARGGLQAWRSVQTLSWSGKLGAGGNQRRTLPIPVPAKQTGKLPVPPRPVEEVQLPFSMEMQRSRKMRFELQFNGQTAVQVYDGTNGWKVRPFLNRNEVESYTPEELKTASLQTDIDGPLVDYTAKGTQIDIDGAEKVDNRDTYKLKLTLKDGRTLHVWIDATTFLEAKIEGVPRRLDGQDHPVEIYYRDYRAVSGLQIPFVLETRVLPVAKQAKGFPGAVNAGQIPVEKIVIEKVEVNPKLDASVFSKPSIGGAASSPRQSAPATN
jgi:hypothetical protein